MEATFYEQSIKSNMRFVNCIFCILLTRQLMPEAEPSLYCDLSVPG